MKLLGCFTKRPVVLDLNADRTALPPAPSRRSSDIATTQDANLTTRPAALQAPAFTPTSIPELHPEYAHAEPYCFIARTASARVVVDRLRGARGQPPVDHAHILRQQGVTVVRGPTYSAPRRVTEPPSEPPASPDLRGHDQQHALEDESLDKRSTRLEQKSPPSVALRVERPSTVGERLIDSSEDGDENVDANLQHNSEQDEGNNKGKKSPSSPVSGAKNTRRTRSKHGTASRSFLVRTKTRKSKVKIVKTVPDEPRRADEDGTSVHDDGERFPSDVDGAGTDKLGDDHPSSPHASKGEPRSPSPQATSRQLSFEKLLERHMDNTPTELLAPIVVPRTSIVFGENMVSSESSSQRYADVEGDHSSGALPYPSVAMEKAVHKVDPSSVSVSEDVSGGMRLRARRKSKPFLSPLSAAAVRAASPGIIENEPPEPPKDIDPLDFSLPAAESNVKLSPIPPPAPLSREPSLGMLSDDGESELPSVSSGADEESRRPSDLFPVAAPTAHSAMRQRVEMHKAPLDIPRAAAMPPALSCRASTVGKRKTVSFHDAGPIIIEPNLRAPSHSLPRSATLAKEIPVDHSQGAGPPSIGSVLSQVRDSVTGLVPLVDDIDFSDGEEQLPKMSPVNRGDRVKPRRIPVPGCPDKSAAAGFAPRRDDRLSRQKSTTAQDRERSDLSFGSSVDLSVDDGNGQRPGSRRVSSRDKQGIREATRRQSMAVARAMSEQIRGVPRSAMLAFAQNEVIVEHEEVDHDSESSSTRELWARRRPRASKSIRIPDFAPGQVPPPPPPPPFSPARLNVRSVRMPPPPPSSPLQI